MEFISNSSNDIEWLDIRQSSDKDSIKWLGLFKSNNKVYAYNCAVIDMQNNPTWGCGWCHIPNNKVPRFLKILKKTNSYIETFIILNIVESCQLIINKIIPPNELVRRLKLKAFW